MKPVFQTLFGGTDAPADQIGNCFPAAIASILEVPLEAVQHFYSVHYGEEDHGKVWAEIVKWLKDHHHVALTYWEWPLNESWHALFSGATVIISGKSPRFDCPHAVVGRLTDDGWELLHDPHPEGTGIIGDPTGIELLIRLDPAQPKPWPNGSAVEHLPEPACKACLDTGEDFNEGDVCTYCSPSLPSLAARYLNEEVRKNMEPFYDALGVTPPKD